MSKRTLLIVCALGAGAIAVPAFATNLVTNGSFESASAGVYSNAAAFAANPEGQLGDQVTLTGWSQATNGYGGPAGYTFLFNPGHADDGAGAPGFYGNVALWGPPEGAANGMPATSPDGGNFLASEGNNDATHINTISQTISDLTPGAQYNVSFDWAGAQQYVSQSGQPFSGAQDERWVVSLGSQTLSTPTVQNASHGFTGWMSSSLIFTAASAQEVLTFMSDSDSPRGVPPFALLDGVSVTAVPEPASWALMIVGVGMLGGVARSRRQSAVRI